MGRDRLVGRVLAVFAVLFVCFAVILNSGCRGIVGSKPVPTNPQPPTSGNNPGNNPGSPETAPTIGFSASSTSIAAGDSVTLSWTTANATSVSISPDPGAGTLPVNGSVQVKPTQTTTYTLTGQGPGGTATQSLTVNVAQPVAPTVTITANPLTIVAGQITN